MVSLPERASRSFGTQKAIPREFLAELIGTFLLVFIGVSCNIQQAASPTGNVTSAQIGWSLALAFGVYLTSGVSASHLNPAFSIAALVNGQMGAMKCVVYIVAQMMGAFIGAAVAYGGHYDDLRLLQTPLPTNSSLIPIAGLFATYPAPHMSLLGAFFDQLIGTALLSSCITAVCDKRLRLSSSIIPLLCGLAILMISMSFGANTGYAINPARDLGPRLLLLCAGHGWVVFTARDFYFWVPTAGPVVGAIVGGWIYNAMVGIHGLNEQLEITPGKASSPYHHSSTTAPSGGYKVNAITVNDHDLNNNNNSGSGRA